ncbi:glycosyltransferase family 2 protein [Bacteroides sp.]|uniref:glycosyltransferase family 2 protein n=1 Tax=Bacteroides sp. TaxID=29523 RepID=UPI00258DDBA6|nr:glycosyltransferase family 2 protein [Bacteroides sp.]
MEDKSVSIIIPVYNAESTLKRCIDSIIKQSYKQWTLILVNDGSTDDSQTICHNYEVRDNRILLLNKENGGVSSARNLGIRTAQTDYLIFVDSDDFLEKNCIENLLVGADCDISFINTARYSLDTETVCGMMTNIVENKCYKKLTGGVESNDIFSAGIPFAKLYKTSIIKGHNICFDERIKNHEDHLFFFDYLLHCDSMYLCSEIGYYWTFRENSNSLSHTIPSSRNMLIAAEGFMKRYPALFEHFNVYDQDYISRVTTEYGVGSYRSACYSLYYYKTPKIDRLTFLKEQVPVMRRLYNKYGYAPNNKKHKLIFIFLCLPIPVRIKDVLLSRVW